MVVGDRSHRNVYNRIYSKLKFESLLSFRKLSDKFKVLFLSCLMNMTDVPGGYLENTVMPYMAFKF